METRTGDMENGPREEKRVATRYPVLPVFAERWSPRSFDARPPAPALLRSMFEAARLAPSAHNTQPARFLIARKGRGDGYERLFGCLNDHNKVWAHSAPVLVLASAMGKRWSPAAAAYVPYSHAMHDLGLAVMSLILQAQSSGLHCHPMAAFEPDLARKAFDVPPLYEPGLVIAVGHLGPADVLPEALRLREVGPRVRGPLEEVVFEDAWGRTSALFGEEADL